MTCRFGTDGVLAFLAVLCLGSGCTTCNLNKKDVESNKMALRPFSLSEAVQPADILTPEENKEADGWSEYAQGIALKYEKLPEDKDALAHLASALTIMPDSQAVAEELLNKLISEKKYDKAIEYLQPVIEANPDVVSCNLFYATLLLKQGKTEECQTHLEKCFQNTQNKKNEFGISLIDLSFQSGNLDKAYEIFNILFADKKNQKNTILCSLRARFWSRLVKEKEKQDSTQTCVKQFTAEEIQKHADRYTAYIADIAVVNEFKELTHVADSIVSFGNFEYLYRFVKRYENVKQYNDTQAFVTMKLDALNKTNRSQELKKYAMGFVERKNLVPVLAEKIAQLLAENNEFLAAAHILEDMSRRQNGNYQLKMLIGEMYLYGKESKRAIAIFNALPSIQPQTRFLLAQAYNDQKEYEKAYDEITLAEKQAREHGLVNMLNMNFYFVYSMICEKNNKINEAIEKASIGYNLNKNSVYACNYYAYLLAEHNTQIPVALELLEKAVKEDPDNAAYIDSLAWAQYRNGDYVEAFKNIQLALSYCDIKFNDTDGVIAEHAAEISQKLGLDNMVVYYYEIAASTCPEAALRVKDKLSEAKKQFEK